MSEEVILKYDTKAKGKGNTYRDLYDAGVKATFKMGIYADREDVQRALQDGRILNPEKECNAVDDVSGDIIICMCWDDGKLGAY